MTVYYKFNFTENGRSLDSCKNQTFEITSYNGESTNVKFKTTKNIGYGDMVPIELNISQGETVRFQIPHLAKTRFRAEIKASELLSKPNGSVVTLDIKEVTVN